VDKCTVYIDNNCRCSHFRIASGPFMRVVLMMAIFLVSCGIIVTYHFNDMFGGLILGSGIFCIIVVVTLLLEEK